VSRAVIAAHDPSRLGGLFAQMFGADAIRRQGDRCALMLGLSRFEIVTPDALASEFADAAPDDGGRVEFMAALTFRVQSLEKTSDALAAGGIDARIDAARIVVPAAAAFNTTLEFRA
jgi:hypothetical protein